MSDTTYLGWPFFEARHQDVVARVSEWAKETDSLEEPGSQEALRSTCRGLVRSLGEAGLIDLVTPRSGSPLDVRSICLARETMARHSALAEVMFAMQGLGTGPITLFGSEAVKDEFLPPVRSGSAVAAFALSEPEAGSDVASMQTTATPTQGGWRINGTKTWISNAGIAGHYVLFARSGEAPGAKGISAFVVAADDPSISVIRYLDTISPHVIATIRFDDTFVPSERLLGAPGEGFKIAMATLDVFRSTVGAAALGFARRALDEAVTRATSRTVAGRPLFDHQMIQGKIADMALDVDTSALLVYRAAWTRDVLGRRITRESSMAKLFATEAAQRVIDEAVQIFGGLGVTKGNRPEQLYRDIRALRIYEGASEVQRVIIARQTIAQAATTGR